MIKNNHMGIHFPICLVYYLQILYKVKKFTRLNFYFLVCLFVSPSLCLVRFVNYYVIQIIVLSI